MFQLQFLDTTRCRVKTLGQKPGTPVVVINCCNDEPTPDVPPLPDLPPEQEPQPNPDDAGSASAAYDFLMFGEDLSLPSTGDSKRRKVCKNPSSKQTIANANDGNANAAAAASSASILVHDAPQRRSRFCLEDFQGVLDDSEISSLETLLAANLEEKVADANDSGHEPNPSSSSSAYPANASPGMDVQQTDGNVVAKQQTES